MITTRTPVADIADHEGASALRRDLEQLSSDAGTKLLRSLGVKGHEAELRSASGHCFALTLLGSYLTDAYNGDIRCRSEVLRSQQTDTWKECNRRLFHYYCCTSFVVINPSEAVTAAEAAG